MECTGGSLDCGWGHVPEASDYYELVYVAGGGPAGQDVVEFQHTPQPQGTPQVLYNSGWWYQMEAAEQGAVRYIRYWIKPITPISFNGTGDVGVTSLSFSETAATRRHGSSATCATTTP
jgi:hypothetical protein